MDSLNINWVLALKDLSVDEAIEYLQELKEEHSDKNLQLEFTWGNEGWDADILNKE